MSRSTGTESRSAFSLNSQLGMSSGPCDLEGVSFDSFSNPAPVETSRAGTSGGLATRSDRQSAGSGLKSLIGKTSLKFQMVINRKKSESINSKH